MGGCKLLRVSFSEGSRGGRHAVWCGWVGDGEHCSLSTASSFLTRRMEQRAMLLQRCDGSVGRTHGGLQPSLSSWLAVQCFPPVHMHAHITH